jgi:alpha-beta hydrolase superfamily lysophospholipase
MQPEITVSRSTAVLAVQKAPSQLAVQRSKEPLADAPVEIMGLWITVQPSRGRQDRGQWRRRHMSMSRKDVAFSSAHDTCAAWFYPAAADEGARPIIVMAHGLTGTRRDRLGAFAERFAAAGIAALVFDYRGFGDSTGEPDLYEPSRQLEDWRAAIALARSLPDIDPERVATFGSSSGGGHALAAAAADAKVAAAISQVPMLDRGTQSYSKPQHIVEKMKAAAAEGRYLPAVGQPHEAALISAPGAEVGWRRVVAIGEDSRWRNRVSAAWLVGPPYSPIQHAASLHCPWLVCIGAEDQVAKPGPAIEAARGAPKGEFRIYPGVDHFDIYDGPTHEAVVADEIEFLCRHLLGRSLCGTTKAGSEASRVYLSAKTDFKHTKTNQPNR